MSYRIVVIGYSNHDDPLPGLLFGREDLGRCPTPFRLYNRGAKKIKTMVERADTQYPLPPDPMTVRVLGWHIERSFPVIGSVCVMLVYDVTDPLSDWFLGAGSLFARKHIRNITSAGGEIVAFFNPPGCPFGDKGCFIWPVDEVDHRTNCTFSGM